jgi:hypothetical protein
MISLVRLQIVTDLWSAYTDALGGMAISVVYVQPYIFDNNTTKAMHHEHDRILYIWLSASLKSI